ncbi:oligopeptidase A, partial [Vibrio parahaemolyticus V-223/04]
RKTSNLRWVFCVS